MATPNLSMAAPTNAQGLTNPGAPVTYEQMQQMLAMNGNGAYSGMPQAPGYIDVSGLGYDAIRNEATRKGDSAWAGLSKGQQALQTLTGRERAANQGAGETAQARSSLAAQGGLSSGARERVAETGQKSAMSADQDLGRQQNLADLSIGIQDATNQQGAQKNLANLDVSNAQNQNSYNMDKYNAAMSAWAADKQAKATASSGKK